MVSKKWCIHVATVGVEWYRVMVWYKVVYRVLVMMEETACHLVVAVGQHKLRL